MKKLFSHGALFVALLLAPMTVFAKQANTKSHHRPSQTAHETRYERNCLGTFEVEMMYGRASKAFDGSKDKVSVLRLYGRQLLTQLAQSAGNGGTSDLDAALQDLATSVAIDADRRLDIGVHYDGKYTLFETNVSYTQNFCNGFFGTINLPIKRLKISDISRTHVTSDAASAGITTEIETVLDELTDANLITNYNLSIAEVSSSGIGDLLVAAGWTCNHDDVENLDFLDTTIQLGVSIPTAKKRDQDKAFELALGYEGHTGITASFDLGIGFYEWMTLGAHVGGVFFLDKTRNLRLQRITDENGWLKLHKGDAKVDMGNIWHAGGHLKADHIFKGFSLMLGYNYVHKGNDNVTPENLTFFPSAAANADSMLGGWTQHAVTVTLEYDMAEEGRRWNPYFSVFYSRPLKGKYIFISDVGGGTAGVNVAMDF